MNIRWKVFEVRGDEISIQDIKNERDVRIINEKVIGRQTRYAYCAPDHSRQRTSIDGDRQHYHSRMEQRIFGE